MNKLEYIKVELIRNEKKEIIERRIYITDISCRRIVQDTYKQNNTYPYNSKRLYPISKKAKDNNINIMIDRFFIYIIKRETKIQQGFENKQQIEEFYKLIDKLELNYTEEIVKILKEENIEKLKIIIYCVRELFLKNKRIVLTKITRDELIETYDNCKGFQISYQNTEKEINNFFDYYYASVMKRFRS